MTLVRDVLERFRSSDGRIKIATVSGVSALVIAIALLVGVLPAVAALVNPVVVSYGGGSGGCAFVGSAAGNEFHINNPTPGTTYTQDNITVTVSDRTTPLPAGRVFDFDVAAGSGFVVYDVVVNGGPNNNHYDYDGAGLNNVTSDTALHAPAKNARSLHNLSHINICYDVPGITSIPCEVDPPISVEGEGVLTLGEVTIFKNSLHDCTDKRASFFIEDDVATLAFLGDGSDIVAGRLDITKVFADPTSFTGLEYDGSGDFELVQWCGTRAFAEGDGNQFSDWLPTGVGDGMYPSLPAGETACKVAEDEDLTGEQFTVVYFEFEDPQFR